MNTPSVNPYNSNPNLIHTKHEDIVTHSQIYTNVHIKLNEMLHKTMHQNQEIINANKISHRCKRNNSYVRVYYE